jgi:hypothetical protein
MFLFDIFESNIVNITTKHGTCQKAINPKQLNISKKQDSMKYSVFVNMSVTIE